ncbi:ATP-binding domain-containing protein [Pseudomonas japonica]|uniref:ATP-binding domain-containing protein n=1 Tax=Pseudomonas japonica TaxID=256466 RepID=UPI0015E3063B|nr:ATP-binding domain-containing protein [Pseudomonas japonica]MBA1245817.1 ATP-binding domain-containing protein [Pseudomonas japonica]
MSFSDAQDVATDALETFHKIEDGAARLLAVRSGEASDALAVINTFTNTAAVAKIASIADTITQSLLNLVREPAISRVVVETDEGAVETYYICRTTSISVKGKKLAGYRTPLGRLAVFGAGESVELEIAGKQKGYRILDKLEMKPQKSDDLWDAIDSIWRRRRATPQTIPSLRNLVQPVDDNAFFAMLDGGSEAEKVREGVVHEIRKAMALRDQAILDKIQDEIFRLSIDHQLIILGPPGTGKTTTLIKRLGQKLDWQALNPDEQRLLGSPTNRQRWMMFTPSDLLKHYVKDAFNREHVAASDDNIKTWSKRRHDLARSTFGILKTGNSGSCILKEDRRYSSFAASDDPRQWFTDFKAYHQSRLLASLREGAALLKDSAPTLSDPVVKELLVTIDDLSPEGLLSAYAIWNRLEARVEPLLKASRATTDKLIQQQGSLLHNRNNSVFIELATFLESLGQSEDEIDDGEEFDDDTGADGISTPSHTAERRAFQAYQQFLQSHARTQYRNGSLGKSSRAARIRDWLGDRVPPAEWLKTLGREMCFQNALRRFRNAWKRYVLDVPTSYRAFRRECLALELYDYKKPDTPAHIDETELDAILLLMLRSARELIRQEFVKRHLDDSRFTELAKISDQFLHQVLVDEATDFSTLQLACMESLTDPSTESFFACGDFNQRITGHGLKRLDQLEWISPRLKHRRINTVYRQSRLLNSFAIKLLDLMRGDAEAVGTLPEHSTHEGVPPVLGEHLGDDAASTWVAERIIEIDARMRSKAEDIPTIAVLVTSEDHVRPMADALTKKLEGISLRATPCADGQSLGNQSDIRVFDVQHIKGLEFEAVFFVGIDDLAEANPALFERFLYVGATRAATYLGMVCHEKLPSSLENIRPLVATHWW